jgi:hypothetical protein
VDFGVLAREVRLSGGYIKNIALLAAFYAAAEGDMIGPEHIARAAHREHQKLGRAWDPKLLTREISPAEASHPSPNGLTRS